MDLNFDDEALKLFKRLNLSAQGQAPSSGQSSRYNSLDAIYQSVDCRPEVEVLEEGSTKPVLKRVSPTLVTCTNTRAASDYAEKGNGCRVFVGNQVAASSEALLAEHNIRYIVNCTFGKSGIPNFFENKLVRAKRVHYLVFPVGHWSLMVGSSDEELLEFVSPLFDFVELAWKKKSNVLVHCLAGAHRAGTTGCLLLMKYAKLERDEAVRLAKHMRPVIDPIGTLPEILTRYSRARARFRSEIIVPTAEQILQLQREEHAEKEKGKE